MSLENELSEFTGTTQYYKHFTGLLYTDGISYLAEHAGAYWLIDLIGSDQPMLRDMEFQLWDIEVQDNKGRVSVREDTGKKVVLEHKLEFTDFPLERLSLYCQNNVLFLPSEY